METEQMTLSCALKASALATTGANPEWDKRIADFLVADALQFADGEFGDYSAADERTSVVHRSLEERFGRSYRSAPAAADEWNQMVSDIKAAEEARDRQFLDQLWKAGRALALTPAPTLAAALFKVDLIAYQDLGNDTVMPRPAMEIVVEDFARLQGEA